MQVSQIMIEPVTIDKDQRLSYALETLNKKGIERLVVVQDGAVTGILTYADIADRLGVSKVVAMSIKRLHVSSAMTDTVITVGPDDDVTEVAQLMIDRGMSGCPVVTTGRGGNKDQVTNGNNGFICSDLDEFEAAVKRLVDEPGLRETMGRNARIYSKAFASPSVAARLSTFLEAK